MRFERTKSGNQDTRGGLLAYPAPIPSLFQRPLLERALPTDHMRDTGEFGYILIFIYATLVDHRYMVTDTRARHFLTIIRKSAMNLLVANFKFARLICC